MLFSSCLRQPLCVVYYTKNNNVRNHQLKYFGNPLIKNIYLLKLFKSLWELYLHQFYIFITSVTTIIGLIKQKSLYFSEISLSLLLSIIILDRFIFKYYKAGSAMFIEICLEVPIFAIILPYFVYQSEQTKFFRFCFTHNISKYNFYFFVEFVFTKPVIFTFSFYIITYFQLPTQTKQSHILQGLRGKKNVIFR